MLVIHTSFMQYSLRFSLDDTFWLLYSEVIISFCPLTNHHFCDGCIQMKIKRGWRTVIAYETRSGHKPRTLKIRTVKYPNASLDQVLQYRQIGSILSTKHCPYFYLSCPTNQFGQNLTHWTLMFSWWLYVKNGSTAYISLGNYTCQKVFSYFGEGESWKLFVSPF